MVSYDTRRGILKGGGDLAHSSVGNAWVQSMLDKLAECIRTGQYTIDKRSKNIDFLMDNGYSVEDQEKILLQLTPKEYKKIEDDRDNPDSEPYWFFITKYERLSVYVKFKIQFLTTPDGKSFALIKSLHEDGY